MLTVLTLILLALATHRVTRFVTRDAFPLIAIPRERFEARWGVWDEPAEVRGKPMDARGTNLLMMSLVYLWGCDWCTSVWVGGILTVTTAQFTSLPLPWLVWPAVSTVTGLIASREPE